MRYKFTATAIKWWDKVNGNTYHSVRISRHRDGKLLYCPFQYGYGDHYRQTALEAMAKAGWIPKKWAKQTFRYERDNNYPVLWQCHNSLKRDCVANGKPGG